ncbi:FtsW/RodA/SpoVE family cell cycle protein [Flintibacter muris]|uniref:FtsW/RodA/SpoVE family cell cycle protein n=1 Tax=Flintibacter muris TaxID=2941327 RepID=UPI00203FA9BF|nr:FtsW/RodA/SpoVE family cell cycle protein [Flintibacter muris]
MARKAKRDLTMDEQLARGPLDLPFLMLVLLLLGIGLIMLFSASYYTAFRDPKPPVSNNPYFYITRQALYAGAGVAAMYLISRINYQHFRWMAPLMLAGSIFLLALCYTPFGVEINGVKRWLYVFLVGGPTFQPSEIAKVAIVLFFSARLCKRDTEHQLRFTRRTGTGRMLNLLEKIGFLELVPYGVVMLVVLVLVVFEPHMSGTILIMVGGASVLFVSGIRLGWFVGLGSLAGAGLAFIVFMTDYLTRKINIWLDPWGADAQSDGYQFRQGVYSIASGGLLGRGLGNSGQKYGFVPEPENDMIFPITVEELGLVGGYLILLLFALLILRGYWLALHARDKFGMLTTVGIITLLATQVFLNIGVITGLIPNTGISLPFFSYGGTALMIQLAEMGMILSISRQIPASRKD